MLIIENFQKHQYFRIFLICQFLTTQENAYFLIIRQLHGICNFKLVITIFFSGASYFFNSPHLSETGSAFPLDLRRYISFAFAAVCGFAVHITPFDSSLKCMYLPVLDKQVILDTKLTLASHMSSLACFGISIHHITVKPLHNANFGFTHIQSSGFRLFLR